MKFKKKYYYVKYDENEHVYNLYNDRLDSIMEDKLYSVLFYKSDYKYVILKEEELIGFFSLNIKRRIIQLSSLYILKKYRNDGIATEVINDVIWAIKHNDDYNIQYITVNSFVESALFFLKRGFNFCKINKKLDYKKKNIILLHKTI